MSTTKTSLIEPESLFAEAEIRAERLVAILRIVISLTLAITFAVAVLPSAPAEDPVLTSQLTWAAATMLGYFGLGVTSIVIIQKGLYRQEMAWFAVTGDCLFLLANIWFSLANTGLSGNYAIALPPIWLAPVVLSVGALRFNPVLQAYVVLLLVCGLVAIAGFRLDRGEGANEGISAASGFLFSWPPNVMRLMMLTLAGMVLVIASARARVLLRQAIEETRRSSNLTRYLPPQVADRLAEGGIDELRRGQRQKAAILFVDIRGFTSLAELMTPDALSAFVSEFRRRVARAADATGGTIDKYVGDSAMVVFGLPTPNGDEAVMSLRCADRISTELAEWNKHRQHSGESPIKIGIGVHWGEVFCGAIGDEARLEFTVLGDTVNVASRLEAAAKQFGCSVVASEEVLKEAGQRLDGGDWVRLEKTTLDGRTGPVSVFQRAL
ncbi:MAG: adenylate/guanylate cyclase domain-containing protein [Cyanobacteria bacterium P01_E01_bin.48]